MSLSGPILSSVDTDTVNSEDAPVSWSLAEEKAMISFLVTHRAEAGDGYNFKESSWSKVADHLRPMRTEGGVKTGKKCKEKWTWVCVYPIFINDV